jgi:hypothetical protein
MKSLLIYPATALVLIAGACKSPKETATKPEATPRVVQPLAESSPNSGSSTINSTAMHEEVIMAEGEKQAQNNYRFIVSFISIGEGTDRNGRETLDGVLASWEKKKGAPVAFESVPWGREGEVDFCFNLKELSKKEQELFIADMKTAFNGRSLIQMTENQPCVHKR